MTLEKDELRGSVSVVTRPRQSTWRAIPMDEALAFVENVEVQRCVKYIPVAAVKVGE